MNYIRCIVVVTTLLHICQTHPVLLRITRNLDGLEDQDSHILLANIEEEDRAAQFIVPPTLVEREVYLIAAYPGDQDLSVSETQIFRPLFTYRQQVAKRLRLKKVVDQK